MNKEKLTEIVFVALGETSVSSWSERPKGVFQDQDVTIIGNKLVQDIENMLEETNGKLMNEAVITFNYETITPEDFIELKTGFLKTGFSDLIVEIFGTKVEDIFEIKLDVEENFPEQLDAYIESLEEVNEIERNEECDDHECVFNFEGQCLKDDEEPEEYEEPEDFLATENENCQCPLCQNEKLTEVLDDLENDYMELQQILKEKDEEIKYLTDQLVSSVITSEYLAGKIRPNKLDFNEIIKVLSKLMSEANISCSNSAGPVVFKLN